MTHSARAIALSVVTIIGGASITGCGVGHAVLGIHGPPKPNATAAPLTVERARSILARDFTAAQQGETSTGAAAQAALKTAYTGAGLRAANARVKLARLHPSAADSLVLVPRQPLLLSVPRGFGFPRVMVAQTLSSTGSLPVLHLLTSPDAATPYRIGASATMLLGSSVTPFDAFTKGSSLVRDGAGLAVAPILLMNSYAAGMAFPAKAQANPPFAADAKAAEVRTGAAQVAKAVATQASFSRVNNVVANSVYTVRQANGDALVFGVIERMDTFKVKSGQAVNTIANKEFVLLTGKKQVTKSALITTLEFVVFAVPRSGGQATLVAASEQVVAGSGS